jgi:thioredoxin reductase (NADPH)
MPQVYDVAIVGAGPAGLAAAIYTTREDFKTIILEGDVVGGLIATTDLVDNYPGFSDGISGLDLSAAMEKHAKRFGAEIKTGQKVQGLKKVGATFELQTSQGAIAAKSVLLTAGSSYRKLDVPGEKDLTGRGVHYCATCDGPLYRDKHLVAVGGGNSALQEGLFLAKFASKITLLVRGPKLKGTEILAEQVRKHPKFEIHYNTVVDSIDAEDGRFASVSATDKSTNTSSKIKADGMFVFIGLIPNTSWLEGNVELDDRQFVKVDKEFNTSLQGVFAAGDIHSGATGQIASAVGEGVTAAIGIRHYLHALAE